MRPYYNVDFRKCPEGSVSTSEEHHSQHSTRLFLTGLEPHVTAVIRGSNNQRLQFYGAPGDQGPLIPKWGSVLKATSYSEGSIVPTHASVTKHWEAASSWLIQCSCRKAQNGKLNLERGRALLTEANIQQPQGRCLALSGEDGVLQRTLHQRGEHYNV